MGSVVSATALPAAAASYPTTDFPQITNSTGATDVTVTWYNRSVGVTGAVSDNEDDYLTTVVCVYAYIGPNATEGWHEKECRGVNGGTKGFNFTLDGSDIVGGFQSVQVRLGHQATDVNGDPGRIWDDEIRTRNRPAA
ncbi:hypothetical protein [Streptomyces justiciae]|uniref:Uncharacterized protein n=1 Tax=Streptomyces justiciae TaxID=2780140 RepID=A0ABU3M5B2_9ACTN|nr:hypothetical protein [Streptomyces justiciae]MDT7846699.1 hypothetical protein [Streptomyces justiciae]